MTQSPGVMLDVFLPLSYFFLAPGSVHSWFSREFHSILASSLLLFRDTDWPTFIGVLPVLMSISIGDLADGQTPTWRSFTRRVVQIISVESNLLQQRRSRTLF